jgi:predicted DNA-binding ribbon-helix-helix protein
LADKSLSNSDRHGTSANRAGRQREPVTEADYDRPLKSKVVKRSLAVGRHRTSVSLEDAFWSEFQAIARERRIPVSQLVGNIDADRQYNNLSSAIRVFVFELRYSQLEDAQRENKPPGGGAGSDAAECGPDDQSINH